MFRGLFGSNSDRPTPPKNQIEVVCPACGAAQYEPRLVVSTFCKKCGAHLTIQKKKVIASEVTRSGIGFADVWGKPLRAPVPTPIAEEKKLDAIDPILQSPVDEEEAKEGGFGVFLKSQTSAPAASPPPAPVQEEAPAEPAPEPQSDISPEKTETEEGAPVKRTYNGRRSPGTSPLRPANVSAPPMNASALQKMKEQGMYRNQYFKDADCFECGHKFKVGRSSRSANCASCGALISLEDIEVNMVSTQSIKTRGDVMIRKRGHISAESIQCKDLRCFGIIESNVQATGDVIFRANGSMIGMIKCRRLIVEKGSSVTFMNEVHADEIDIQASVTGSFFSTGPLVIAANGSVNGEVTARSVSIEPGGELNGAMNIVRTQVMPRPILPATE